MTISTTPFLNGRTSADDRLIPVVNRSPQRRGGVLQQILRRFRPAAATSAQHHHRREETDAYLDRGGLSSVDWLDAIAHDAQR